MAAKKPSRSKKVSKTEEKLPHGRPKELNTETDFKMAYECGKIGMTQRQMARLFQVSEKTVNRRMQIDDDPFCLAYHRGKSEIIEKLLKKQINLALSGNIDMLKHTAKHVCDQHDKLTVDNTSSDGSMTPKVIERVIIKNE